MVGIAMILYSLWMVRVWQRDMKDDYYSTFPWFIHGFLGIGILLRAITCLGHIAADTANAYCLSCYMVIIFMLLLLEIAMMADVFLNSDWKKDLPEDPTGRFDDFKDFVKSNFDICKWIGLLIILVQGFSILLATALRTLGPADHVINYESDDNYAPSGLLPLLNPHPHFAFYNEIWKTNK
ncbi:hypothetical protein F0562_014095 [Nyssa sinensis]|uniref:Tetraspanin-19-like n=1 Tax=Nyssa sinensis TaxID=561372 RepID=A0A5J4ZMF3_9ASTE|nr:hypothetical protein F0562_014095 [Nyssa sinensis]